MAPPGVEFLTRPGSSLCPPPGRHTPAMGDRGPVTIAARTTAVKSVVFHRCFTDGPVIPSGVPPAGATPVACK